MICKRGEIVSFRGPICVLCLILNLLAPSATFVVFIYFWCFHFKTLVILTILSSFSSLFTHYHNSSVSFHLHDDSDFLSVILLPPYLGLPYLFIYPFLSISSHKNSEPDFPSVISRLQQHCIIPSTPITRKFIYYLSLIIHGGPYLQSRDPDTLFFYFVLHISLPRRRAWTFSRRKYLNVFINTYLSLQPLRDYC